MFFMLIFLYLVSVDESRQIDSLNRLWGVVKYVYHGWHIANFDTLPPSGTIPEPEGEYRILDNFQSLHLKDVWEYRDKADSTIFRKPGMSAILKDYSLDLLDWGKYIVFYVRGKGKYEVSFVYVYNYICKALSVSPLVLSNGWYEVKMDLEKGVGMYDVRKVKRDPLSHETFFCDVDGRTTPFLMWITPLADTLGTYEYEIELSPVYLVK